MMKEQVFSQALLLTGQLEEKDRQLLQLLCAAAASALELRLKAGLSPRDCAGDFVAAASLYAVAALGEAREESVLEEFKAGDLTVRTGGKARDAASRALQKQADQLMGPCLADRFTFLGV